MLRKDVMSSVEYRATTADPQQIARFDALAEEWCKPNGKFKIVHGFNAARIDLIIQVLRTLAGNGGANGLPLNGLRIADVGCGVGIVEEFLQKAGADVVGIVASAQNIEIARRHAQQADRQTDVSQTAPYSGSNRDD